MRGILRHFVLERAIDRADHRVGLPSGWAVLRNLVEVGSTVGENTNDAAESTDGLAP
jgi:hypothetical protein